MDHRPVHAGKPSSAYRVKKFIRRHKLALAAATVLVISMIVGTGFSLWYATQAQSARVLANQSEQLAHRRLVLLQAQQEKLKAEQKKLERERSRLVEVQEQSERHYTLAREAVAKLIDEVASEKLIAFPELSELRETLLQTADQFYTELLEDNPGDHLLLIARADVRESLSQSDLAYQDYLQATEVQPNSSLTLRSFASFLRNTQDPELRDGERALQFAQRAVELSPMDAGAWLDLAWVYDHHFPGRRAEAINAFMKASELTSNQEYKAMRLGMALDRQGNHKAAIDAYTEAIEASQAKASHPFVMRGTCYFDVEEYQLAIDDFTRAVAIDAFNFVGFERRADAWIALEEYGKAAVDLEQSDSLAINRKPNQRTLLLCYLHAGQWDKAASLIENLSGNEPSHYSLIDPGLSTLIESSKTQELINARDQFLKRILLALRNEIDEIPRCLSTLTQLPQSFLDVHRHHPWFREQLVELANSMIDLTVDTTISGYAHRAWLKRSLGLDEEADKDFDLVFDRMAGRPIIPIEGVQFHTMADNENSFYEQCHVADLLSIDAWTLLNQDRYQDSIRCRVQAFDLYQRVLAEVPATPSMRRAYLDRLDWLQHSNQLVQSGAVTPPDNWNSLDIGSIDFSAAGAGAVTYGENLVQAKTLHDYGDYVHALYVHAIEEYEIALARRQDPVVTNELAWLLATCPDEDCRNLDRALELSLRTSQDAIGGFGIQSWNTHGVALYYSGCYREAIAALEKSEEFNGGQMHPMNALFLAMAHHQVGDRVRAEEYWESAEEIVGQLDAKDSDLTRFRNEARQLIFAEPAKQVVGGSAQAHSPGNAK
jgi:tetratricopeptide (TPR) repeat protein